MAAPIYDMKLLVCPITPIARFQGSLPSRYTVLGRYTLSLARYCPFVKGFHRFYPRLLRQFLTVNLFEVPC